MVQSIENTKTTSVKGHIYGIGGIGKSSLLQYWSENIDSSILIDCNVLFDLDSQVGHLVRGCKSKGMQFSRYDLLWSIRKRVLDGLEPATDENRKWLIDAVSLIPGVGGVVDFGAKIFDVGKKLRDHLLKAYGELNSWFLKELGENWEEELIHILWRNPNNATLLMMSAVQSDLNERKSAEVETLVILIDNVDSHSTKKWNIDGQLVDDSALWHKMISGIQSCVVVTAGRNALDNSWSKTVGVEQLELVELDMKARQDLYHSRNFNDSNLRESVDRICKGHPFMMQLVIDVVEKYQLTKMDLDTIKSESLDIARTEVWRVFFNRSGQLTKVLDRAALLPFFDRDILSAIVPTLKSNEWMDFKSLSFVKKQDDNYWILHDLARELVLAELDLSNMRIIEDIEKLLLDRFQNNDDPLYYGLSVSLHEFISVESAMESLNKIIVDFRLQNRSNYTLRALEGVRFRGNRLQGHFEQTKGNALMDASRFTEAELHIRNALAIQKGLQTDRDVQDDIAHTLISLGTLLGDVGRSTEAESAFIESVDIRRELLNPEDHSTQGKLAIALANLGNLYSILNRYKESLVALKEAEEIYTELTAQGEVNYFPDLARVLNNLGILHKQMGDFDAAERVHQEALKLRIQLARQHSYYKSDLASTLLNIGGLKAQYGQYKESLPYYFKALDEYESLKNTSSDQSSYDPQIAMTLNNISQSLARAGKPEEAREKLVESAKIYRRLSKIAPEKYEPFLGNVLTNLSMLHMRLEEDGVALQFSDEFIEIYRRLVEFNPFYESYLIDGLIIHGNALSANNRFDQAKNVFQEVIDHYNEHPQSDNHRIMFNLSCAFHGIATVEMKSSNHIEAVSVFKKVIEIRKELASVYPAVYSFELAKVLTNIGESYRALGQLDESEAAYRECIDLCSSSEVTVGIREIAHHTARRLYDLYTECKGMSKEEAEKLVQEAIEESLKKSETVR